MGRRAEGFTLIELLVVVVIGAVLASLVMLSVANWRSADDLEHQLQRLAALLQAQCDAALFQSRPRGVRLTPEGYDVWQSTSVGWVRVPGEGVNRPRQWSEALAPRLLIEGRVQALAENDEPPQIVCQPLGDMTAFELRLGAGDASARLTASAGGQLLILTGS